MISTVVGYLTRVFQEHKQMGSPEYIWFRGEPDCNTPLLPSLYRPKHDGSSHDENKLLQMFRMRAPSYGEVPKRGNIDQWLFLAQHVGIPTRLLDWTQNSLLGLFFALNNKNPIVWLLDPIKLNNLSISLDSQKKQKVANGFPLTWHRPDPPIINIGHENIRGAWEYDQRGLSLPVAVHPTYLHPRMSAQRSAFTVHGYKKDPISDIVPEGILSKLEIRPSAINSILSELKILGIMSSTAFPDLDGLADELKVLY